MGFGADIQAEDVDENRVMERVEQHDLVKYGLIPELIGRIPVIAVLENLDKPALIRIMTEPKNSIVKQYTRMFQMDGVQLEFQPEALAAMADVTLERQTAPAVCAACLNLTLKELMFQIPSDSTVEKVTITPETVRSGAEPIILRNPKNGEPRPDGRCSKERISKGSAVRSSVLRSFSFTGCLLYIYYIILRSDFFC